MASFNGRFIFESWVEIQGCGGVGIVVLKVSSDYLEWNVNNKQMGFVWMRHSCFVGSGSIDEFLLNIFHLEEHGLRFIGIGETRKGRASVMSDTMV